MGVHYGKADFITYGKPSLFLDFANKKSLVDRISGNNLITFTRTSSATYVGADGLIKSAAVDEARFDHNPVTGESLGLLVEEARTNLATYSEQFDNAAWIKNNSTIIISNAAIAPDGTSTADKVIEANGATRGNITTTPGVSDGNTISVFAKAAEWTHVGLGVANNGGVWAIYTFNLSAGTVAGGAFYGGVAVDLPTIVAVGNGWYRCSVRVVTGGGNRATIMPFNQSGDPVNPSPSLVGNGTSGIYTWGAQLEAGAFPTSYIPTPATFTGRTSAATFYDANGVIQTAASGVARSAAFFPDSSGVMRPAGLLLEAAGTNLVTYSEQFNDAAWSKLNTTITANSVSAPDGTATADTFVESTDGSSSGHYINQNYSVTNGTLYSFSVYAKYATRQWLVLTGNRNGMHANFDLQNGVVGNKGNLVSNQTIQSLPNGWYRCTAVITADSTITVAFQIYSATSDGTTRTPSYVGTGSNAFYLWGAQLEVGSYATSYIPTVASTVTRSADTSTSATVTRSADVAQITGGNFSSWYNNSEGTFLSTVPAVSLSYNLRYLIDCGSSATSGAGASGHVLFGNINNTNVAGGVTDVSNDSVASPSAAYTGNIVRVGYAYKVNNFNASVNGTLGTLDTNGAIPTLGTQRLVIGSRFNGTFYINRTISRLVYYPTRLTDTQLQNLTK